MKQSHRIFLVPLIAAVSIFVMGLGAYLPIAPGTLSRETLPVGDTTFFTRLYLKNGALYAQCTSSKGGNSTMCVGEAQSAGLRWRDSDNCIK